MAELGQTVRPCPPILPPRLFLSRNDLAMHRYLLVIKTLAPELKDTKFISTTFATEAADLTLNVELALTIIDPIAHKV